MRKTRREVLARAHKQIPRLDIPTSASAVLVAMPRPNLSRWRLLFLSFSWDSGHFHLPSPQPSGGTGAAGSKAKSGKQNFPHEEAMAIAWRTCAHGRAPPSGQAGSEHAPVRGRERHTHTFSWRFPPWRSRTRCTLLVLRPLVSADERGPRREDARS